MTIEDIIDKANITAAETFKRWVSMRTLQDTGNLVKMPSMPADNLEEAISKIMMAFQTGDEPARRAIVSRINDYLRGRLLEWAAKMAALAIQYDSPDYINRGLTALVMEGGREEIRDSITAMAMLYHSAVKLNMDAAKIFAEVASMAEPGDLKDAMIQFCSRRPEDRDLAAFYLHEVKNEGRFGYEQLPWWREINGKDRE